MSVTLQSPTHLVASLQPLMGITLKDDIVALWLQDGQLVVTGRIDLVDSQHLLQHLVELSANTPGTLLLVYVTDRDDVATCEPGTYTTGDENGVSSITIVDVITTGNDLRDWYSKTTGTHGTVSNETKQDVAQQLGRSTHVESKDDMRARYAPREPFRSLSCEQALSDEDAQKAVSWWQQLPAVPGTPDEESASYLTALTDYRVRDRLLADIAREDSTEQARKQWEHWSEWMRCAPQEVRADIACLAVASAWLAGDGVRAGIAYEIAMNADSEHRLAGLFGAALENGVAPATVREMLAGAQV